MSESPEGSPSASPTDSPRSEHTPIAPAPVPPKAPSLHSDEKINKMRQKRIKIAEEIVKTEKDYVKNINIAEKRYHEPMLANAASDNSFLSKEDVRVIFGDLKIICSFNDQLLFDLDVRFSKWDDSQCIGDVFLTLVHYFKFYTQYVSEYNNSIKKLKQLRETNEKFNKFMQELQDAAAAEAGKYLLKDFLIMPVQRIPRYRLLLKEMVQNTWEDHPDYSNLKKALDKVSEVADFVEEQGNSLAMREKIIEIQEKLSGAKNLKLLEPGRKYIRESAVNVQEKEGSGLKERQLYLFSDILLITRPHKNAFELKTTLYLEKLSSIRPSQTADKQPSLNVIISDKPYVFVFKTETEKKQWLTDLVKHYTDHLENTSHKKHLSHGDSKIQESPTKDKSRTATLKKEDQTKKRSATASKDEIKITINPLMKQATHSNSLDREQVLAIKASRRSNTIDHGQEPNFVKELIANDYVKKSPSMDSFSDDHSNPDSSRDSDVDSPKDD